MHYGFWNFCGDHPFVVVLVVMFVMWGIAEARPFARTINVTRIESKEDD